MKKDLYDILRDAGPGDLELLWSGIPAGETDEATAARIREAILVKAGIVSGARARHRLRRLAAAAACLVLVLGVTLGTRAYAAEAKEYKAAVIFFRENGLDAEGLSRGEMTAVYRDILTESFTYGRTAEVVQRSLQSDRLETYDIFQTEPDPADVEALWNYRKGILSETAIGWYRPGAADVRYEINLNPGSVFRWTALTRYEEEKMVWSIRFTDFCGLVGSGGYLPLADGVLIWGTTPHQQYVDDILVRNGVRQAYLAKVGADGTLLWQLQLANSPSLEIAYAAADNGDGTYAVFTAAETGPDEVWLHLIQVDASGQFLSCRRVCDASVFTNVAQAVKTADGYLLTSFIPDEAGRTPLARVTEGGELTVVRSFRSQGKNYLVDHVLSCGGRTYLSVWAVPSGGTSAPYALLQERINTYLTDHNAAEIPNTALTAMAREYFSAALLVLDGAAGSPVECYAIRGSVGGDLSADDAGNLIWDVERIDSARLQTGDTPGDSLLCMTRVFRYIFGPEGMLLYRQDTGLQGGFGVLTSAQE